MNDNTLRDDEDALWRIEGARNGWELPFKAAKPFRLPVIRHVRFAWKTYCVRRHAARWGSVGIGFGVPKPYDLWILYAISRGWC